MKIAMACDHGGFELAGLVREHLTALGHQVTDFGTYSTDSCDYPEYAVKAARAVASGQCELGVVICTTGIGMSIAANKVRGVRCALCSDCYSAEMTRRHNDANMLAMGAYAIGRGLALKIVDTFLTNSFDGGRHARRVGKIGDIETGAL